MQITNVTGAIKSTVVTLLRNAEITAVTICSSTKSAAGLARAHCAQRMARYWNTPERCAIDMIIIMPTSVPIVFQSTPLSASA